MLTQSKTAARTVDGEPAEDIACFAAALDLIDPLIIKRHPRWPSLVIPVARLRGIPEIPRVHVLEEFDKVCRPTALHRLTPDAKCFGKHRTLRR